MRTVLTPASIALVLGLAFLFCVNFSLPQMWLYPMVRQVVVLKTDYQTRNMSAIETTHFIIKYDKGDENGAAVVAEAAEAAYEPVSSLLDFQPKQKAILVVHSDKAQLNQAFGWTNGESAMGVYWGGVIQVLSPQAWQNRVSVSEFIRTGPVVHEYTHLVFDYMAQGNYPRWFTEGLAQYAEYKINHYEWITNSNQLTGELYSMQELNNNFDGLSNKGLAYREALAAIRYITEVHGEDKLKSIITKMQKGQSADKAIENVLNLTPTEFEAAWQKWAIQNMEASL